MDKVRLLLIGVIVFLFLGLVGMAGTQQEPSGEAQTITKTSTTTITQRIEGEAQIKTTTTTMTTTSISTITQSVTTTVTEKAGLPYEKGKWNRIIEFTSSSSRKTELFKIPSNQWRINYTIIGDPPYGVFGFYVYEEGRETFVGAVLFPKIPTSDSTYVYRGPGNFYLDITTTNINNYRIIVEAWIPG